MKKYATRDREAGNIIEYFSTKEEAEQAIEEYEKADKAEGIYEPDFYEVAECDMMDIVSEGGSIHDFDKSKVEQAFCIETAIDNWEVIADAVNASMGDDNSPIDLEAEYRAGYLRVFDDGVVMLYL